jgi:YHS domain-containing protein
MKKIAVLSTVAALLLAMSFVSADEKPKEEKKVDLKDVKCPVSGAAVKEASIREYKGGKVYFCCDKCPETFDKKIKTDTALATKSNLQLATTKQVTQEKCPLSGADLDKSKVEKVSGIEVYFCCEKCQGKVAAAKDDPAKIDLVFADKAFDKAFKIKGAKKAKRDKEN